MNHDSKIIHLSATSKIQQHLQNTEFFFLSRRKLTLTNLKRYLIPQQGIVQAPRASENPLINLNRIEASLNKITNEISPESNS